MYTLVTPLPLLHNSRTNMDLAEPSQAANCDQIPIVDLSNLSSTNIEDRQQLAQTIYDACTQVGFFYIKVWPDIFVTSCYMFSS